MKAMKKLHYILFLCVLLAMACRTDEIVIPSEYDRLPVAPTPHCNPVGMYVLNEVSKKDREPKSVSVPFF